ncbi:MAG: cell division ATPase MinD [Candidatus Aenigmatarchaeota archaeon]
MIIGVISAKGGVGKTTVVSNLGAVLVKEFGKKVLVVDGNITTPTLGIHLGMLSQEKTIDDVLDGNLIFNQAIYIHPCGLHIAPASLSLRTRYPDVEKLKEILRGVKESYDVIFIDGAAGIGREVLSTIQASDGVLVVTNPEMTSIVAAIKAIKISNTLNIPVLGIVINKVTKGKHELKISDVEELCEVKVISTIPYDKKIPESIKKMTPVVLLYPNSPSSLAFKSLAAYIIGEAYPKETFWDKLRKILRLG